MRNNDLKFTKMRYAFTTMEPTPSSIMADYETTRDDILQHIYPVLVHQSRVPSDVVALRIEGLTSLRVMFLLRQTNQLLSKTTQLKYRIKPSDLVEALNRNIYKFKFAKMSELLGLDHQDDMKMYVLTNPDQKLGSGLIVHDKVLRHILDTIGEDIYVLPSSTHELIVIPSSVVDDENYLTKMVHEINTHEVEPEDRLSDDVYHVNYTTMKFRTIQYQE